MSSRGGEARTDWEILMTTEVEAFLDGLYGPVISW
jgi:hypothetical protein